MSIIQRIGALMYGKMHLDVETDLKSQHIELLMWKIPLNAVRQPANLLQSNPTSQSTTSIFM